MKFNPTDCTYTERGTMITIGSLFCLNGEFYTVLEIRATEWGAMGRDYTFSVRAVAAQSTNPVPEIELYKSEIEEMLDKELIIFNKG